MDNSNVSNSVGGGLSFLGFLQLLFIALKVFNLIDWPWMVILIPLWINLGVVVLMFTVVLVTVYCC